MYGANMNINRRVPIDHLPNHDLQKKGAERAHRNAKSQRDYIRILRRNEAEYQVKQLAAGIERPEPEWEAEMRQNPEEELYYNGEDPESVYENVMMQCPTLICTGKIMHHIIENGLHQYYCTETNCQVNLVTNIYYQTEDFCSSIGESVRQHYSTGCKFMPQISFANQEMIRGVLVGCSCGYWKFAI
ncbi:unnamed protein product [Blepharisma stoltei]|uniref:Uncharacterized protein n=1 Tax=Blepharisma stoltei TaxID=1481888 RepID=A0AAU9IDZ4_9CILI|nr:unnamed protein product [Blepharisma stoltei]